MNPVSPRTIETRSVGAEAGGAVALQSDGDGNTLVGHAAVFNQWTEINSLAEGRFLERISPGAFSKTIAEHADRVRVLLEHGHDGRIGNRPLGQVESLAEDVVGLAYRVRLFDAPYVNELKPAFESGVYGSSFRFSSIREQFDPRPARSEWNRHRLPERTLQELRLHEFGPCTFPAYSGATAALRDHLPEPVSSKLAAELAERKAYLLQIELEDRAKFLREIELAERAAVLRDCERWERDQAARGITIRRSRRSGRSMPLFELTDWKPKGSAKR